MSLSRLVLRVIASTLFALPALAIPGEINACKYLLVEDFSNDPFGIAQELRAQASANGFALALSVSDIPANDLLKACVMSGSWWATDFRGQLAMRVVDASGSLVAEAVAGATARVNASRAVRSAVSKIYSELGYTGFSEDLYWRRSQREYPTRPTLEISEETIRKSETRTRVEGIWTDPEDRYRLGIVPALEGTGADFIAVVLRSNSPIWQAGEVKAEIRSTASPDVFTCTYFLENKRPAGTTLTVEHNSLLRGSVINTPTGPLNLLFVRVWPKVSEEIGSEAPAKSATSGTGFLLNRSGLIATNWHVVADAKNISVAFPSWDASGSAEVVVKDKVNDLAVLRVNDSLKLEKTCLEIPFQLASANSATLGERVSTVGYPLIPMLGSNPKFFEGAISSKSGFQDDPRWLQVSAQVQPGSSGSPLFDANGNVIGIRAW